MTDNTVPVSELGLCDDETKKRLEEIIPSFDHVVNIELNTSLTDGVGHAHVKLPSRTNGMSKETQEYLIEKGMCVFDPQTDDDGSLSFRVTTDDVMRRWMDALADGESGEEASNSGK